MLRKRFAVVGDDVFPTGVDRVEEFFVLAFQEAHIAGRGQEEGEVVGGFQGAAGGGEEVGGEEDGRIGGGFEGADSAEGAEGGDFKSAFDGIGGEVGEGELIQLVVGDFPTAEGFWADGCGRARGIPADDGDPVEIGEEGAGGEL